MAQISRKAGKFSILKQKYDNRQTYVWKASKY